MSTVCKRTAILGGQLVYNMPRNAPRKTAILKKDLVNTILHMLEVTEIYMTMIACIH